MKKKSISKKIVSLAMATTIIGGSLGAITPTFAQTKPDFSDVKTDYWAHDMINDMRDNGIINGYPDNTFKPGDFIKREHVAALFQRSMDLTPIRDYQAFKDVTADTTSYYDAIKLVQQAGIFDGDNGLFRPKEYLSRAQMAKVLTNAFHLKVKADYSFPDVPEDSWSSPYIKALYSNGITTGNNGKFLPNDHVTRTQYAVFLYRALHMNPNFEAPPIEQPPVQQPQPEKDYKKIVNANPSIFDKNVQINDVGLKANPFADKVLTQGLDFVKQTNLKFVNEVGNTLSLQEDGYKSPIARFPIEFLYEGGQNDFTISFDFRKNDAIKLAQNWMTLSIPELKSLEAAVNSKSLEAREMEKVQDHSGNRQKYIVGDYEVYIGTNQYFEFLSIEVQKI